MTLHKIKYVMVLNVRISNLYYFLPLGVLFWIHVETEDLLENLQK